MVLPARRDVRHAPRFDQWDAFDPAENGLVELPTEEWHGLVFVDPSGQGDPLEIHLAGLEPLVAAHEPERLRVGAGHDYVVEANWKIVIENYQECYHCAVIHPELCMVSPPRSGENYRAAEAGAWVGGWMALRDDAETMSLSGRSGAGVLRGLDGRRRREVVYLVVFPNVLLSLHPDYVMTHVLSAARARPHPHPVHLVLRPRGPRAPRLRPGLRRRLLGHHQPTGLLRLRIGATGPRLRAVGPGPARPRRGRRVPIRHHGGQGLSGTARQSGRSPRQLTTMLGGLGAVGVLGTLGRCLGVGGPVPCLRATRPHGLGGGTR